MRASTALIVVGIVSLALALAGCSEKKSKKRRASSGDEDESAQTESSEKSENNEDEAHEDSPRASKTKDGADTKKRETVHPAQLEAARHLKKLHKSAGYYYTAPRVEVGTGKKIDCQFPANQEWTPPGSPCDNKDEKFEVGVTQWTTFTWSSLNFQVLERHYTSYKVESSGTLGRATTTFRARFDSDCDGEWEEMAITVRANEPPSPYDCEVASEVEGMAAVDALIRKGKGPPRIRPIWETMGDKKRAKQEAVDMLDRMYKSAGYYYTAPRVARGTGLKVQCQFPRDQDWTPTGSPCNNDDQRFEVNTSSWTTGTWAALNFQMNDRHYAAYKVESVGTVGDAKANLMARTDVDCDGKWEVYGRLIEGNPDSSIAECTVKPGSKFLEGAEVRPLGETSP